MNRQVDINGNLVKARRSKAGSDRVDSPAELPQVIQKLSKRVSDLEASVGPSWTDFECTVSTAGATVSLAHGYSSPVRWYVVHWGATEAGTVPTAAPALVMSNTSSTDTLVLKSYVAGKAVVRVEPSPHSVFI